MSPSAQLEQSILGLTIAELKWWHSAYAYQVAFDSMRHPRCREIWERVGRVILK